MTVAARLGRSGGHGREERHGRPGAGARRPMWRRIRRRSRAISPGRSRQGGRALAAYLKPREEGQAAEAIADATTEVLKTLGKVGEYWTADPARLMEAQTRLFGNYLADLAERRGAGRRRRRRAGGRAEARRQALRRSGLDARTRSSAR